MSSARTHDPQDVYHFIWRYHNENHISPTLREIADGCGIGSTNTVTFILNRLQRKGLLRRIPHISRGIVLMDLTAGDDVCAQTIPNP